MTSQKRRLSVAQRQAWAETYAKTPFRDLPWFSPTPYPWVKEVAEAGWWRNGSRLLDIGCGAGTNALYLSRLGYRVDGVDVAPGAVEAARGRAQREKSSARFHQGDALDLPFPRGRFGGAIDVGCFHTLPRSARRHYSRELARVLRPRARLAIACVAREHTAAFGPPHRLSVEEIVSALEPEFQVRRVGLGSGWTPGRTRNLGLTAYLSLFERRSKPQPPPR